mmetsp:Transcript_103060/g.142611  ORF Transcript_103060/g.142611 Transcript_103060/m.142611 type:complete len:96 (+) Transcript_103060:302-589(+)
MAKEGFDDIQRDKRDSALNSKLYTFYNSERGIVSKKRSCELRVGDIIQVSQNERVPADLVLLQTTDKSNTVFIRTDQLDGETDWKVRRPINLLLE